MPQAVIRKSNDYKITEVLVSGMEIKRVLFNHMIIKLCRMIKLKWPVFQVNLRFYWQPN